MFDFPNAPAIGDRVTGVGGIVYVWDGVKWTSSVGAVTVQSMGDVGRNLIHNSMFNVAQRGVGPFTGEARSADRWQQWIAAGDTLSTAINTTDDGIRSQIGDEAARLVAYLVFTGGSGATNLVLFQQNMEGVRRFAGKTVTVSFWAATSAGTAKVGVSIDQFFGTGGSPSATAPGVGLTITATTTWTRYSVTRTIPSAAGKVIGTNGDDTTQCNIWLSAGSNYATASGGVGVQSGGVAFWGVQLEIGSVVTPLEKPDPQVELANCQRFYQVGQILAGTYAPAGVPVYQGQGLVVSMRGVPTAVVTLNSSAGLSGLTITADGLKVFLTATTAAVGTYIFNANYSLSADL